MATVDSLSRIGIAQNTAVGQADSGEATTGSLASVAYTVFSYLKVPSKCLYRFAAYMLTTNCLELNEIAENAVKVSQKVTIKIQNTEKAFEVLEEAMKKIEMNDSLSDEEKLSLETLLSHGEREIIGKKICDGTSLLVEEKLILKERISMKKTESFIDLEEMRDELGIHLSALEDAIEKEEKSYEGIAARVYIQFTKCSSDSSDPFNYLNDIIHNKKIIESNYRLINLKIKKNKITPSHHRIMNLLPEEIKNLRVLAKRSERMRARIVTNKGEALSEKYECLQHRDQLKTKMGKFNSELEVYAPIIATLKAEDYCDLEGSEPLLGQLQPFIDTIEEEDCRAAAEHELAANAKQAQLREVGSDLTKAYESYLVVIKKENESTHAQINKAIDNYMELLSRAEELLKNSKSEMLQSHLEKDISSLGNLSSTISGLVGSLKTFNARQRTNNPYEAICNEINEITDITSRIEQCQEDIQILEKTELTPTKDKLDTLDTARAQIRTRLLALKQAGREFAALLEQLENFDDNNAHLTDVERNKQKEALKNKIKEKNIYSKENLMLSAYADFKTLQSELATLRKTQPPELTLDDWNEKIRQLNEKCQAKKTDYQNKRASHDNKMHTDLSSVKLYDALNKEEIKICEKELENASVSGQVVQKETANKTMTKKFLSWKKMGANLKKQHLKRVVSKDESQIVQENMARKEERNKEREFIRNLEMASLLASLEDES